MSSRSLDAKPRVLDISGQGLSKVGQFPKREITQDVAAIIADGNNLSTLHGIEHYTALIQLSACENSLVRMDEVAPLINLVTLNLQTNSILEISGLEHLVHLEWLCLAGNSIQSMHGLSGNGHLSHLDLSDNCITEFEDLTMLTQLKTLLLHGNAILSLQNVAQCLPPSIDTLTLAENEVADLNEVSFLASLKSLTQLSIMSNPAVSITDSTMFDYRPYVVYWCPDLTVLDGLAVTQEERQQSSTLFPPDQPHPFSLGEHWPLVQYLTSICPLGTVNDLVPSSMVMEDRENINPNIQSTFSTSLSISGLEDLLKSGGSDTMEKLKALQLVEQMISAQEQLLKTHQEEDLINTSLEVKSSEILPRTTFSKLSGGSSEKPGTGEEALFQKPGPPRYAWGEEEIHPSRSSQQAALDKGTSVPGSVEMERGIRERNKQLEVSSSSVIPSDSAPCNNVTKDTGSSQAGRTLSLQERKQQQLKLLNQKIAQRHSKLPHKTKTVNESRLTAESGVKKSHTEKQVPRSRSSSSVITKGGTKPSSSSTASQKPKKTDHTSHLKSVSGSKSSPAVSRAPPRNEISSNSTLTSGKHSTTLNPPRATSVMRHEAVSVTRIEDENVDPSQIRGDNDMLDSISHYIPLPEDDGACGDGPTGVLEFSDTDTLFNVSSLASSLTQAYGIAHTKDHSHLLSSLVGPASSQIQESLTYHKDSLSSQVTSLNTAPTDHYHQQEQVSSDLSATQHMISLSPYGARSEAPPTTAGMAALLGSHDAVRHGARLDSEMGRVRGEAAMKIQAAVRGYLTRKRLHPVIERHRAATLIQAVWRGYVARRRDPEVVRVRTELSRMKLEAYVATLYGQLQGCRQELAHQANKTQLQEETLQSLLVEVEALRKWRSELEAGTRHKASIVIQKHWRGYSVRKRSQYSGLKLTSRSEGLWALCCSLQNQVRELQSTLATVLDKVNLYEEESRLKAQEAGTLSEVEMPPATDLTMSHFSATCVLLRWTPASSPPQLTTVLRGYRIYVNGVPEGMVGASKSKAYIEGLDPDTTYRITIRAVYNRGESHDSNPIVASLSSQKKGVKLNPSPTQSVADQPVENTTTPNKTGDSESPYPEQKSNATQSSSTTASSVDMSECTSYTLPQPHQRDDTNCNHSREKLPPPNQSHSLATESTQTPLSKLPGASSSLTVPSQGRMTEPTLLDESSATEPSNTVSLDTHLPAHHQLDTVTGDEVDNQSGLLLEDEALPLATHINDETVSVMSGATEEYVSGESSPCYADNALKHGANSFDSDDGSRELNDSMNEHDVPEMSKPSNKDAPLLAPSLTANRRSLEDKPQNESELNQLQVDTKSNALTSFSTPLSSSGSTLVESTTNHTAPHTSTLLHSNGVVGPCFMTAHPSFTSFDDISGCQSKHVPELIHRVVAQHQDAQSNILSTRMLHSPDTVTTTTAAATVTESASPFSVNDSRERNNTNVLVMETQYVSGTLLADCQTRDRLSCTVPASVKVPTPHIPSVSDEQATRVDGKLEQESESETHSSVAATSELGTATQSVSNSGNSNDLVSPSNVTHSGMDNNTLTSSQVEGAAQLPNVTSDAIIASKENVQKPDPGQVNSQETPSADREASKPGVESSASSSALLASELLSQLEADLKNT